MKYTVMGMETDKPMYGQITLSLAGPPPESARITLIVGYSPGQPLSKLKVWDVVEIEKQEPQ